MGSSPRSPAQLWVAHEHTRTPRSVGRSCPETAPATPDPPPAPSWSPLPLHFALRRGPLLFSRHARLCPGADSCAFAGRLRFPTFLAHLQPPRPCCQHCAHADLSPSGRAQAALARQARCRLISPLPRTAAIFAHGHPSAHVRPCRGHLPRLPRTPRDMGTRAHPSPSRAALAQEASDRHWISVPFVALSSRNLSSLPCLDHCGPHPTQHTLSPRPCGSWVPGSH